MSMWNSNSSYGINNYHVDADMITELFDNDELAIQNNSVNDLQMVMTFSETIDRIGMEELAVNDQDDNCLYDNHLRDVMHHQIKLEQEDFIMKEDLFENLEICQEDEDVNNVNEDLPLRVEVHLEPETHEINLEKTNSRRKQTLQSRVLQRPPKKDKKTLTICKKAPLYTLNPDDAPTEERRLQIQKAINVKKYHDGKKNENISLKREIVSLKKEIAFLKKENAILKGEKFSRVNE